MTNKKLPLYFKSILWSYDFPEIDSIRDKKTIILNSINYGDLRHWHWIADFYGKSEVVKVLKNTPTSEIRSRVINLVSLLFGINDWNYASRSANK